MTMLLINKPPCITYPHKLHMPSRDAIFDRGWVIYSAIHDEFELVESIEEWLDANVREFTAHAETRRHIGTRQGYVRGMNLDYYEFVFAFKRASDLVHFKLRWF